MTGMLASVANLNEARVVAELGVDIIDLKNPAAGSLGALSPTEVRRIVGELQGIRPISATIGDLEMKPSILLPAVEAMAETGVDYVKIGFFPGGDWDGVLQELQAFTLRNIRLVAVLLGDCFPELDRLAELAEAGFAGAMLDTLDKRRGSLREICATEYLADFVAKAKAYGLLTGLAGSLRPEDVAPDRKGVV